MQYLGGKSRLAKKIAGIMESSRPRGSVFTDVFTGGLNIVCEMSGKRIANDANVPLINMYKAIQNGWEPPEVLTEDAYDRIKAKQDQEDPMTAFAGIGCSFGGKWFGGYARSVESNGKNRNYAINAKNSLSRKFKKLDGVKFSCLDYQDLKPTGLMYCDPPYMGTTGYDFFKGGFESDVFWDKARAWSVDSLVFISEYHAPPDFVSVAEFERRVDISGKRVLDRLFVHEKNLGMTAQ